MKEKSTSLQEGFLANLFPLQGSKKGKEMTVISGRKCFELYGRYGRLSSLVRMFLDSSEWNSKIFALRWKVKVMKSNRLLFHLQASERGIKENGSGLLLTITASDAVMSKKKTDNLYQTESGSIRLRNKSGGSSNAGLVNQIRSLPTLKAQSANSPGIHGQGGWDVQTVIASLPTLSAADGKTDYMGENRNGRQENASTVLRNLTGGKETGLRLHPNFAEVMQGYPIGWTE